MTVMRQWRITKRARDFIIIVSYPQFFEHFQIKIFFSAHGGDWQHI